MVRNTWDLTKSLITESERVSSSCRDTGETTWEPLTSVHQQDPYSVVEYVFQRDLQDKLGWRLAKRYARTTRHYVNQVIRANQLKREQPKYKFGIRVPDNAVHALQLDCKNGNTYWRDVIKKYLGELDEFDTFQALLEGELAPDGYKCIPYMIFFDVKCVQHSASK